MVGTKVAVNWLAIVQCYMVSFEPFPDTTEHKQKRSFGAAAEMVMSLG